MRGLLVVLVAGCVINSAPPDDPGGGIDDPHPPVGFPGPHRDCSNDGGCATGNVCTRNGECLPPSQVRAVHVSWLMNGRPADYISCTPQPDLSINIHADAGDGRHVSYAPVPCVQGKFTVDKLPLTLVHVELGPARGGDGWQSATLDASGEATLDMKF